MRQALGNFPLLGIAPHTLVIGGRLQHLVACILNAQIARETAAFKRPFSAPSAFRYGDRQGHLGCIQLAILGKHAALSSVPVRSEKTRRGGVTVSCRTNLT